MNELSRIQYLDAMGIDTYVSRSQLPGAAPTRRLAVVRRTAPSPVRPGPADPGSVAAPAEAPVMPRLDEVRSRPAATEPQSPAVVGEIAPRTEAVKFSLAVIFTGGIGWVEDLGQRPLAREQIQLVQAMARALGGESGAPDVSQFDWPMHSNHQLGLGVEAAQAGVAGFLRRHMDQRPCRGLVLLGEVAAGRLPGDLLSTLPNVITAATLDMLQSPRLKQQAWRDLQPLLLQDK